jgi:hypothetical protein
VDAIVYIGLSRARARVRARVRNEEVGSRGAEGQKSRRDWEERLSRVEWAGPNFSAIL